MIAKTAEEKAKLKEAKLAHKAGLRQLNANRAQQQLVKEEAKRKREENPPILKGLLEKEHPLADDYPVYWNYHYVVAKNGVFNVIMSDVQGTVKELRRDLSKKYGFNVGEIFSCDLKLRNLL